MSQHFVIGDTDTWRERVGIIKRYPIEKGLSKFIFKWDSTVLDRLKYETEKIILFGKNTKMYRAIQIMDWKIDTNNPLFKFERMKDNYFDYSKWSELSDVIVKI